MGKKTLKEKIKCVAYSTLLFAVIYFLIGAWLKSDGPNFDPDKAYELVKDTLTITAAFLAPVAAFILFSDWREQHNKQVRNEFALKAFNQFELFEKTIQELSLIHIEMDTLVPEESRFRHDGDYRPIYPNDEFFKDNGDLILAFFYKIRETQEVFNILLDSIRYFGIVANRSEEIAEIAITLIARFQEISTSDEEEESYSEYLQLLEISSRKVDGYFSLRDDVSNLIITNLLMTLKAD